MIKKHHTHLLLLSLFFTGLIVLWWAGPTERDQEVRKTRIVPELMTLPPEEIHRVEIENEHGQYVFERQGRQWQLRRPVDGAADPALLGRLMTNLRELRRSPDAGTIQGDPSKFGLSPPAATVRVFGPKAEKPLAALEIGRSLAGGAGKNADPALPDRRYVRTVEKDGTKGGIEVIDGKLVTPAESDTYAWRDKVLFDLPTFGVTDLKVSGPDRDLEVQRIDGHWHLRKPLRALADDDQVEGALAEITSLRVAEGPSGFVAEDVKKEGLAKYGLDHPLMTVALRSTLEKDRPLTLDVGHPIPDHPDLFYARRGDQDEVVMIDGKELRDLGTNPHELRSKKVADIEPARATFLEFQAYGQDFRVARTTSGWSLTRPSQLKADAMSVQNLLLKLNQLVALEFLDPAKAPNPKLDPPVMRLKVWQGAARERLPDEPPVAPRGEPALDLRIGRHGTLKTIYGQIEGDSHTVLALPDSFLEALPKNAFAFRDRTLLTVSPASIARLTVKRDARTYEMEAPGASGSPNDWKLLAPVPAAADPESVTQLTMLLSNLLADEYVTDKPGDGKEFGLDRPVMSLSWETRAEPGTKGESGTLKVGAHVPRSGARYATIEGKALVFTLGPPALQTFQAEYHSHRVLSFPADRVSRLVLRWPGRTLAFFPKAGRGAMSGWRPEPGADITGFDLSRVGPLVNSLATLKTQEFVQFLGIFPASMGFDHPRLAIEARLSGSLGTKVLRIGNRTPEGASYATVEEGAAGAVFTLAEPAWADLARVPERPLPDLPENVFTPEPARK